MIGDSYPVTNLGRVVGVATMLTGVLLFALPIAILATNFTDLYKEKKDKERKQRALKRKLKQIKREDLDLSLQDLENGEKGPQPEITLQDILDEEGRISEHIKKMEETFQQSMQMHGHLLDLLSRLKRIQREKKIEKNSEQAEIEIN